MALNSEVGFVYTLNDPQSGYSGGVSFSHTVHLLAGPHPNLAVHVGLSAVQARRDVPCGAFVGVSQIGDEPIMGPENWLQTIYQAPTEMTISARVFHGFMKAWSVVQFWD